MMTDDPPVSLTADEAIDRLYREHHLRFVRLAYMLTQEVAIAEEVVQEAFVRVWRAWDNIRDPSTATAYMRATVVNLSTSFLRRRTLEFRHHIKRIEDAVELDATARLDLVRALGRLPQRQRTCVVLRFFEDLSEAEVARVMGISVGAVKSQTHKALKRLEGLVSYD